jgi:hypothetical protein
MGGGPAAGAIVELAQSLSVPLPVGTPSLLAPPPPKPLVILLSAVLLKVTQQTHHPSKCSLSPRVELLRTSGSFICPVLQVTQPHKQVHRYQTKHGHSH